MQKYRKAICHGIERSKEANDRYSNPDNDPRGVWSSSDISVGPAIQDNIYTITTPSGREVEPPAGRSWRLSRNAFVRDSAIIAYGLVQMEMVYHALNVFYQNCAKLELLR